MRGTNGKLKRASREAADWVSALKMARDTDPNIDTLAQRFQGWLDAAPENRAAFDEAQSLCEGLGELHDRARWNLEERPEPPELERGESSQREWASFRGRVLAGVLLLALGGGFLYLRNTTDLFCTTSSTDPRCPLSQGRQTSPAGRTLRLALSDGTRVILGGQIWLDLDTRHRLTRLESGQASFQVTKAQTPFEVTVGPVRVKTVGTAFSVKKTGLNSSEIVVSEGELEVFAPNNQYERVKFGQAADFNGSQLRVHAIGASPESPANFRAGPMLRFRQTPLGEAVRQFNLYNTDPILEVDRNAAQERVGGQFFATNPEGFAEVVEESLRLQRSVAHDPIRGIDIIRLSKPRGGRPPSTGAFTGRS
jgi:ferric-dicitrate binding protein FerR (iron transport regulator)